MITNKQSRRGFLLVLIVGLFGGAWLSLYFGRHADGAANLSGRESIVLLKESPDISPAPEVGSMARDPQRIAALTDFMERSRDIGLNMNSPLEFHGRIIDQFDQPVSGVTARLEYDYYNRIVLAVDYPHQAFENVVSDAKGEISFAGKKGLSLTVRLQTRNGLRYGHSGYWSYSFWADKRGGIESHPTSREHPFIFRVYRLGQAAKVKTATIVGYLEADRRTYGVSLAKQKIVASGAGDFDVSVWQTGDEAKPGSAWGVSLQGTTLQLQATDDPFLFWAPAESYESKWDFSWADGVSGYHVSRAFRFWIKQRDTYGSLTVDCTSFWKDKFQIVIKSALNEVPGDPNLQPVLADWKPPAAPAVVK